MKENNIFPEDILHNTVEYHIAKYSKKSNWIFLGNCTHTSSRIYLFAVY